MTQFPCSCLLVNQNSFKVWQLSVTMLFAILGSNFNLTVYIISEAWRNKVYLFLKQEYEKTWCKDGQRSEMHQITAPTKKNKCQTKTQQTIKCLLMKSEINASVLSKPCCSHQPQTQQEKALLKSGGLAARWGFYSLIRRLGPGAENQWKLRPLATCCIRETHEM